MPSNKTADMNSGLGDLSSILTNQSVSDLSWLNVDEEEYRRHESLPKQNLDIIPDLQKALSFEDGLPHQTVVKPYVMVNSNPLDVPVASKEDMTVPIRNRTSRLIASGLSKKEVADRLKLEFSLPDIRLAKQEIESVFSESGLLGNVYIDSSAFPRCAVSKQEQKEALSSGKNALFVLSSSRCTGCVKNNCGVCSALGGKKIVDSIPYGPKLAASYAVKLASENRPIDIPKARVSSTDWKSRIQQAFSKEPTFVNIDGVQKSQQNKYKVSAPVTEADIEEFLDRKASAEKAEKAPSPRFLKYSRRMMDGHDDTVFLRSSGEEDLVKLSNEYGILGHTYIDLDAFKSCKEALEYINNKNTAFVASNNEGIGDVPDFVIRRAAVCTHCKNDPCGACNEIKSISTIVSKKPEIGKQAFAKSLIRAVGRQSMSQDQAVRIAKLANLKQNTNYSILISRINLTKPKNVVQVSSTAGLTKLHSLSQVSKESFATSVDQKEVRSHVSHLMNLGLSGHKLKDAILKRYSSSDLANLKSVYELIKKNAGIQGHFFIDPSIYKDYGSGCSIGSGQFKKSSVGFLLAGEKCIGCTYQNHPGLCSKYAKGILKSIPDEFIQIAKEAKEKAAVTEVTVTKNPVEEFGLKSEPLEIPVSSPNKLVEIEFNHKSID